MQTAVFIPHLRGVERLRRTLQSLGDESASFKTFVADNGSEGGSREMVRAEFPGVSLIELHGNHGFGRALNEAVRRAGPTEKIVFLNDDVECRPGFVESLVAAAGPGDAMVAGVLVQDDRPDVIDSAGMVVEDRTLMAFDYLHGMPVTRLGGAQAPLGPTGAAALFRTAAFEDAGGFDERIFGYYEDVDLVLRMRALGYRSALAPAAVARHAHSATLGSGTARKHAMSGWSRGYMMRRYGISSRPAPMAQAMVCEGAICAGQMLRTGSASGLRGRIHGFRSARDLSKRSAPAEGLEAIGVIERLRLRAERQR